MPAALCAGRLSITTISLRLRVGARHCLTYARNLAPFIEPSTVHGARMPLRRSAATKVMVFQWPCGTRPISLSPRGQRPLSRTILVLAAVSSTKTRWAGSNMPCSRIQRWRARATSARSCSAACRLFFESDVVMLEEAPHRAAAARNLVPVHRQNRLVQGQVWPSRNQTQQKICMLLQRRDAPAPRLSRTAARLPKALDPDNRRAGTDIKLLGRRAPRRPAFNFRNHSRPHVFRIGLRHRPASQNRINADRLSHPSPPENLPDASENSQINPSTIVRAARAAGSRPYLPSGFQGRCKIATLHAGFGVIRGMSDNRRFDLAVSLLQEQDFVGAEKNLLKVLKRQPGHVGALNTLAILLARSGKHAQAEKHFLTAIQAFPSSDATYYNYGITLRALGRLAEARDMFDKSLAINPSSSDAWNNRGVASSNLGDFQSSIAD